ncbi:MAG: hypothetical protein SWK76_14560 [Actinomycetota bacterium]|nr:hypothetical protein [Actinomycetota bacterium]
MKRVLILIAAIGLMAALLTVTGCGDSETVTDTSDSGVTETEVEETTAEIQEVVVESADEIPIYPGAEHDRGKLEAEGEPGVTSTSHIMYKTSDSYEEVVDWYVNELGEPTIEDTGDYPSARWDNLTGHTQGDDKPDIGLIIHSDEDGALVEISQMWSLPAG